MRGLTFYETVRHYQLIVLEHMSNVCVDAYLFFKTLEPTDIIIRTVSKLYLNLGITNILHFLKVSPFYQVVFYLT